MAIRRRVTVAAAAALLAGILLVATTCTPAVVGIPRWPTSPPSTGAQPGPAPEPPVVPSWSELAS